MACVVSLPVTVYSGPLATGRRGEIEMRKRQQLITEASSTVRKSVAYESGVGGSTEK